MTAAAAQRCSVLSAVRQEPMLGTGFPQAGVLLVEQPGAWGRSGLADSGFDPAVAAQLEERAAAEGLRMLAIRRPERAVPGPRRWAVRPAGSPVLHWHEFGSDAELLDAPLTGAGGTPDDAPLYLVCIHAKRDQCCAVFGRALALALQARRPGRVWGCSHTGGHRFAPVVLTLPDGSLYGRVGEQRLDELIAATERGETLPDLLRGELGHPPAVQAALAYARAETGVHALAALRVDAVAVDGPLSRVTLTSTAPAQSLEVTVEEHIRQLDFVSCGKPDVKTETGYVPAGIRILPA